MEIGDVAVHGHEVYPSDIPSLGYTGGIPGLTATGMSAELPPGLHPQPKEPGRPRPEGRSEMSAKIIVSYDGTASDDDALAFGRLLSKAGASLALAYVRHSERLAESEAEHLLEAGARWLDQPDVPRHVVLSRLDAGGAARARRPRGSGRDRVRIGVPHDARARRSGHLGPERCSTAARSRSGSPRPRCATSPTRRSRRIAAVNGDEDPSATTTAEAIARQFGSAIATKYTSDVGLVVLGSKLGNPGGHGQAERGGAVPDRPGSLPRARARTGRGDPVRVSGAGGVAFGPRRPLATLRARR